MFASTPVSVKEDCRVQHSIAPHTHVQLALWRPCIPLSLTQTFTQKCPHFANKMCTLVFTTQHVQKYTSGKKKVNTWNNLKSQIKKIKVYFFHCAELWAHKFNKIIKIGVLLYNSINKRVFLWIFNFILQNKIRLDTIYQFVCMSLWSVSTRNPLEEKVRKVNTDLKRPIGID